MKALGRHPTLTELGIFSVMWYRALQLQELTSASAQLADDRPRVLQGPGEMLALSISGMALRRLSKSNPTTSAFIEPYQVRLLALADHRRTFSRWALVQLRS